MKRTNSRPIILPLPTFEMHAFEAKPRILPFPNRAGGNTSTAVAASAPPSKSPSEADLSAVRDRLFRMIVANQWDRSHGNRAS